MIKKFLLLISIISLSSCAAINDTEVMKKYKEGQKKKTFVEWQN
jgi:hypothetical protein